MRGAGAVPEHPAAEAPCLQMWPLRGGTLLQDYYLSPDKITPDQKSWVLLKQVMRFFGFFPPLEILMLLRSEAVPCQGSEIQT